MQTDQILDSEQNFGLSVQQTNRFTLTKLRDDEIQMQFNRNSSFQKNDNFHYINKVDIDENEQENQPPIQNDPYQIPPDFYQAKLHGKACKVGQEKEGQNVKQQICECCARAVEREVLDLNCCLKELSYLGSGYTLFFEFLKYSILFLVLLFISSGGFNLVTNYWFGEEDSDINWSVQFSLANKKEKKGLMKAQEILNMITIFVIICLLQFYRKSQRQTDNDCDEQDVAANDYTIMVTDIPLEFKAINDDYDDELKLYFENLAIFTKDMVVNVNLCYNIEKLQQINKLLWKEIENKKKHLEYKNKNKKFKDPNLTLQNLDNAIKEQEKKYDELENYFIDGKGQEFMKNHFAGVAFVQFKTEQLKEYMLKHFQDLTKENPFHGHHLKLKQAPYPSDVFWQNLHLTKKQKIKNLIKSYIITTIILLVCFGIVAFLLYIQKEILKKEQSFALTTIMSLTISLLIVGLNVILEPALEKTTEMEGCQTRTEFKISFAKKLSCGQFIISALITFIIEILYSDGKTNYEKLFGVGGICQTQLYVFISNSIIPTIIEVFFFKGLIKVGQRKVEELKGNKSVLTQQELNELYEDFTFEIELKYSYVLKTMYLVAFYSPIIPLGIMLSTLGLIGFYWINKYNVVRRNSIKFSLSAELSIEMTEMIEYVLPLYAVACVLFNILIYDSFENVSVFSYIGIGVGLIHAFLPMQEWNEKFCHVEDAPPNKQTYYQVVDDFHSNYALENPATGKYGKQQFCFKKLMRQYNINVKKLNKKETPVEQKITWQKIIDNKQSQIKSNKNINISNSKQQLKLTILQDESTKEQDQNQTINSTKNLQNSQLIKRRKSYMHKFIIQSTDKESQKIKK